MQSNAHLTELFKIQWAHMGCVNPRETLYKY